MNIPKIIVFAFGGMAVLAGCMSLEERLASSDIQVRNEAEYELMANVSRAPKSERLAAIRRVKNPKHLEFLATCADESTKDDGLVAVDNIEDTTTLISVARNARSADIRKAASSKIQDEKTLCDIACGKYGHKGAVGDALCLDALSRLKDKALISKVAEVGKSDVTTKSAFQRLDQVEKMRIALRGGRQEYLQDVIAAGQTTKEVMDVVFAKGDSKTKKLFIKTCENEELLLKVADNYGTKLSSDECAALASRQNMTNLMSMVSVIADRKIAEELESLIEKQLKSYVWHLKKNRNRDIKDIPDRVRKDVKEKFSKISDHKVRMKLLMRGLRLDVKDILLLDEQLGDHNGPYDICDRPIANVLVSCMSADEAREIEQFVRSHDSRNKYKKFVEWFVPELPRETFVKLVEMDGASRLLDIEMHIRIVKKKEIVDLDSLVRKRVNFKIFGFYEGGLKNETANYVWQNATLEGAPQDVSLKMNRVWWELTSDQKQRYRREALLRAEKIKNTTPVFCGLYIGMPLRDFIAVLNSDYSERRVKTMGINHDWRTDKCVYKIILDRKLRYKLFPKEDKEFWPAFIEEFMPKDINKKAAASGIFGGVPDMAFRYGEMCYVLKSMKYGVEVSFGCESGKLIIDEFSE